VKQQRHDEDERLVGRAGWQDIGRPEIGLNHTAFPIRSALLDLQVDESLRLDRELIGKAVALGLPSFVVRGAELAGCSKFGRLRVDGCGGPWRAGARRLRRSSYMRPISVTGRPL